MAQRLGPALAYGPPSYDGANAAACSSWPLRNPPSDWRGDFRAQGADPVLVVGSVGDPSTPYSGAVALAATLDSARLLTEGGGPGATHTSFFGNACIRAKVVDYLVSLKLPSTRGAVRGGVRESLFSFGGWPLAAGRRYGLRSPGTHQVALAAAAGSPRRSQWDLGTAPNVRRTCSSVVASTSCVALRVASPRNHRRVAARLRPVQHSSA